MLKVNCSKYDDGFCTDFRVPKCLKGIGARLCTDEINKVNTCEFRTPCPKPKAPPPPPKPKRNTGGTAIDVLGKASKALDIVLNEYHIGRGNVLEQDAEARALVEEAGGYLQYLIETKKLVDDMHTKLLKLVVGGE